MLSQTFVCDNAGSLTRSRPVVTDTGPLSGTPLKNEEIQEALRNRRLAIKSRKQEVGETLAIVLDIGVVAKYNTNTTALYRCDRHTGISND